MTSHTIASGIRAALLAVALSHVSLAQRGTATPSRALTIDHVSIIDGTGAAPRDDMRIVVRDGVIIEVGSTTNAPTAGQVIDRRGLYAIPGLIDGHVRLAGSSSNERAELLRNPLSDISNTRRIRAVIKGGRIVE